MFHDGGVIVFRNFQMLLSSTLLHQIMEKASYIMKMFLNLT